jgi:hypothetical protein
MSHVAAAAQVWRVTRAMRVVGITVAVCFVALAWSVTAVGFTASAAIAMWLVALLVALGVWRWYLVPYVALTPDGLVVQGVFAYRSVRYRAIREAKPGLYGMRVQTTDDDAFVAWAVQKSKLAEWTHRHTRADTVVGAIMERVELDAA